MATTTTFAADAAQSHTPSLAARRATAAGRFVLGVLFVVMGLNGFLNFIPPPTTPIPAGAVAFGTALAGTGYMFPLIKGTELLAGLLLVGNRFVPLALVLLAPVTVNILAFHAFLAPDGVVLSVVIVAVHLALAWAYRQAFRPLLAPRAAAGA